MRKIKLIRMKCTAIFLTIPMLVSLCPYKSKAFYKNNITSNYYYSNGNIHFYKNNCVELISNQNDVIVIDCRDEEDSDMRIEDSYKIYSIDEKIEIINELIKYDEGSSKWKRTKESMLTEWILHNIGYYLGVNRSRTRSVDFNNNDEKKYSLSLKK